MKQTKLPSRKRRVLRRVLFALVLLFLVNHILLVGLLFPFQAVRQHEERAGTGRTAVVCRDWAPEMHWSHLVYLTENEQVTMLSGMYLTPFGWTYAFGVPLDCTGGEPVHGGFWSMSRYERLSLFYVFGRVDSPDIDLLQVMVQHQEELPGEDGVWQVGRFAWGLTREDFIEKDGQFYFLLEKYPVDWSEFPSGFRVTVLGNDKEGNIITRQELDQGASSNFG